MVNKDNNYDNNKDESMLDKLKDKVSNTVDNLTGDTDDGERSYNNTQDNTHEEYGVGADEGNLTGDKQDSESLLDNRTQLNDDEPIEVDTLGESTVTEDSVNLTDEMRFDSEGGEILHEEGYSVVENEDGYAVEEGVYVVEKEVNEEENENGLYENDNKYLEDIEDLEGTQVTDEITLEEREQEDIINDLGDRR